MLCATLHNVCNTIHLRVSPLTYAVFTSSVGKESAVTVAVLSVWPMIVETTKRKGTKEGVPYFPWNAPWEKV